MFTQMAGDPGFLVNGPPLVSNYVRVTLHKGWFVPIRLPAKSVSVGPVKKAASTAAGAKATPAEEALSRLCPVGSKVS